MDDATFPEHDALVREQRRLLSLREDVTLEAGSGGGSGTGTLRVRTPWGAIGLGAPDRVCREALWRMTLGPVDPANLADGRHPPLEAVLARLEGVLVHSLAPADGTSPMLSVAALTEDARFAPQPVDPSAPVRLSHFAALRRAGAGLVLESPLARFRVRLHRAVGPCLAALLGEPRTIAELTALVDAGPGTVAEVVAHLAGAGMLGVGTPAEGPGGAARFAEDDDPDLAAWSHHDLFVHVRSRAGRTDRVLARDARALGLLDGAPPLLPSAPRQALPRPGESGPRAVASDRWETSLGDVLWAAARVRATGVGADPGENGAATTPTDDDDPDAGTGVGMPELELYLTTADGPDGAGSVWYYDAPHHGLVDLDVEDDRRRALLDGARAAAGRTDGRHALLTVTLRMARLPRMVREVAYAASLVHLGALSQAVRAAAGERGLRTWLLLAGDIEVSRRALRLPWPTESTVGELLFEYVP